MRFCALQLVAVALFVGLAGAQEGQSEARAILDKAIKAHGGEAHLSKYKAAMLKTKGHIEVMGGFDFTQELRYQIPNKFRDDVELEINGMQIRVTSVYNAGKAGIEFNGKKIDMGKKLEEALTEAARLIEAGNLVALRGKAYELSIVGEATINKKPAVGIRFTKEGQRDITIYFDKKTHLMTKVEHRTVDPMSEQELTEERIFTEYQKVDGIPEAKKVVINRDGKKYAEAEVLELKRFEKLDDSEFKVP